jgi:hypothetical protein
MRARSSSWWSRCWLFMLKKAPEPLVIVAAGVIGFVVMLVRQ